jgi:hypothetical protein
LLTVEIDHLRWISLLAAAIKSPPGLPTRRRRWTRTPAASATGWT